MNLKRILVPTDFGPAATAAFEFARGLAEMSGASLHLLHIVDDLAMHFVDMPYPALGEVQTSLERGARLRLEALAKRARARDVHTSLLTSTSPATAICGFALDEGIDLIVMGTHGHVPVVRMFLGAVADRVVRTAPCPVLTVRVPRPADTANERVEPALAAAGR